MKFRDKIKNKVKAVSKLQQMISPSTKPTHSTFDESHINITFINSQARTQLSQIKVQGKWLQGYGVNPNGEETELKLNCKWFRRTLTSMEEIKHQGESYQMSLDDVGTSVQLQCLPSAEGIEYQGMPIIQMIGPVILDPETQSQTNQLLSAQKATFCISFKQLNISHIEQDQTTITQGRLTIINNSLLEIYSTRKGEKGSQLLCREEMFVMGSNYPEVLNVAHNGKMVSLLISGGNDFVTVELENHKVRDVFCLLVQKLKQRKNRQKGEKKKQEVQQKNQLNLVVEQMKLETQSNQHQKQQQNEAITDNKPQSATQQVEKNLTVPTDIESSIQLQETVSLDEAKTLGEQNQKMVTNVQVERPQGQQQKKQDEVSDKIDQVNQSDEVPDSANETVTVKERVQEIQKLQQGDVNEQEEENKYQLPNPSLLPQTQLNHPLPNHSLQQEVTQQQEREYKTKESPQLSLQQQMSQNNLQEQQSARLLKQFNIKLRQKQRQLKQQYSKRQVALKNTLTQQISLKLRKQLQLELRPKIKEQCNTQLRPVIKAELLPKLKQECIDYFKPLIKEQTVAELTPKLRKEIEAEMVPKLRKQIETQLKPKLKVEVEKQLKPQLLIEVEKQLKPKLKLQLEKQLQPKIKQQLQFQLRPKLKSQLQPLLKKELQPLLRKSLQVSLRKQLQPILKKQIQPLLRKQIQTEVRPKMIKELQSTNRSKLQKHLSLLSQSVLPTPLLNKIQPQQLIYYRNELKLLQKENTELSQTTKKLNNKIDKLEEELKRYQPNSSWKVNGQGNDPNLDTKANRQFVSKEEQGKSISNQSKEQQQQTKANHPEQPQTSHKQPQQSSLSKLLTPYQQLQHQLQLSLQQNKHLISRQQILTSQKESVEQQLMKFKVELEELQAEKKHLQKKYESLFSQIQNNSLHMSSQANLSSMFVSAQTANSAQMLSHNSSINSSPVKSSKDLKSVKSIHSPSGSYKVNQEQDESPGEKINFTSTTNNSTNLKTSFSNKKSFTQSKPGMESPYHPTTTQYERMSQAIMNHYSSQQELAQLKKQLLQLTDENTSLRAILQKDKKASIPLIGSSTSSKQLKLQIIQLKKLANRLTEELTDKNHVIENMKIINKELNSKLCEVTKDFHLHRMAEITKD